MKKIEGNGGAGGVRQLPVVMIEKKRYFVDRRLLELRRVDNPHEAIRFHSEWDLEDYLIDSKATPKWKPEHYLAAHGIAPCKEVGQ